MITLQTRAEQRVKYLNSSPELEQLNHDYIWGIYLKKNFTLEI